MNVFNKDTNEAKTLSLIDPKTGVDWAQDFIGNTGALEDGQFTFDDELDAYVCDTVTLERWEEEIEAEERTATICHDMEILKNRRKAAEDYEKTQQAMLKDLDDCFSSED